MIEPDNHPLLKCFLWVCNTHVIYTPEAEIINIAKTAMEEVKPSRGRSASWKAASLFERIKGDSFMRGLAWLVRTPQLLASAPKTPASGA